VTNYSATNVQVAVHNKSLAADTEDTVTLAGDRDTVEVINLDGAASIYFTVDNSAATVDGQNTFVIPAAIGSLEVDVPTAGDTKVRLISDGTPTYSVQGPKPRG